MSSSDGIQPAIPAEEAQQSGILAGVRVIDAASFLAGPCAATIMGDYGASVIKVEPLTGDRHRTIAGGHPIDHSWQLTGRNKRSLALNIATDEGREVLLELARTADVIVFNFRTEQLAKYRLTWDDLHAVNPRLIFAQISGYGLYGADANRPAFDLTGWFARTGISDMMYHKDSLPSPPAGGVGDHATAMSLFGGIMLALRKRDSTGEASMVSTSLANTGAWANGLNLQAAMTGVDHAARRDLEGWSSPFSNVYATNDGRHVMLAVQNMKRDWPALATGLGHAEWLEDERFSRIKAVFKNRFAAKQLIADAFAQVTIEQACELLQTAGIVHSKVYKNAEVVVDPQLIDNGLIVSTDSDEPGYDRALATPFAISGSPQRLAGRAPTIGAHSRELLREYGLDDGRIDELIALGIVGTPQESAK